ncbi:MAG: hypothetical protein AB1402_07250 [Bacillota bacterium]
MAAEIDRRIKKGRDISTVTAPWEAAEHQMPAVAVNDPRPGEGASGKRDMIIPNLKWDGGE